MTVRTKDTLLLFGRMVAGCIQWACALAGGLMLLLIPIAVLSSQGMLPWFRGASRSATIEASPPTVIAIYAALGLILAALFLFFRKLRAIIASAGEGDPFTPENASRLTAMAWLFLGVKVLALLVGGLRIHLARLIDSSGTDSLDFSVYDLDAVVIVIVLFILARIFRHGAAMREDLRGTV